VRDHGGWRWDDACQFVDDRLDDEVAHGVHLERQKLLAKTPDQLGATVLT